MRGRLWELRYGGRSATVEDCRGLRYIALLVQQAGVDARPVHARELVALATGQSAAPIELDDRADLLDDTARKQLLARLADLAAERDRHAAAERFERAAELDDEYEQIAMELKRASGQKKGRGFTDSGEKARKAVGKAITEALTRIASHKDLSSLASHLRTAIRKGLWLSYSGDSAWQVDYRPPLPGK
jgi:hypothetical protein